MFQKITNKNEQLIVVSYLNDSFCLLDTNEWIKETDVITACMKYEDKNRRSFVIQFINERKMPIIGLFHEWDKQDNGKYRKDRMMFVDTGVAQMLQELNLNATGILFAPKK